MGKINKLTRGSMDWNLSEPEVRYLRKCVRLLLGFRTTPPPRRFVGSPTYTIPEERAKQLRSLAVTFTEQED